MSVSGILHYREMGMKLGTLVCSPKCGLKAIVPGLER